MKIFKLLIIFFTVQLVSISGFGQTTRIHFFNSSRKITLERTKDVNIKLKGYSLVETQRDSLLFSNENNPMNIKIEKGKDYYFLIINYAQAGSEFIRSGIKIEEVSEMEFFMTLLVNKHGRKPDEIFID
jgi:uncharacterized protein YjiK